MIFFGTAGGDDILGTNHDDVFKVNQGGNDDLTGLNGNDTFRFGATFDQFDFVNGGNGSDTVSLAGGGGIVVGPGTLREVEFITLAKGANYSLVFQNSGLHEHIEIDASAVGAANNVSISGGSETARSFTIIGSAGGDDILGGPKNDVLIGGGGLDGMAGGPGLDTFVYQAVSDSTGSAFDIVTFDVKHDLFVMPDGVSGVDPVKHHGTLDGLPGADFNHSLKHAIGATKLAAHHAVVFTPDSGIWAGATFLVVDANGTAGYQANEDFVIRLFGDGLTHIDTSNFLA